MAKELKRRGFRFVGPTTAYALMQATGMVDDHVADCWRASADCAGGRPAQRPRKIGFCLATKAAVALRWSVGARPARSCSSASLASASASGGVAGVGERLLDRGVGRGRAGGQPGGQLERGRQQLLGLDHRVDQAHLQRGLGA